MKTIATFAVAVALAASLTACGGTTMVADRERTVDPAGSNVSTSQDGTVNGTNHTHHHNHPTTTPGSLNTNAMGAGNHT